MPTYAAPTDFGIPEAIRFTWDNSPLSKRPVTVQEMSAVLTSHLQYVFQKKCRMVNSDRLGHLAENEAGEDVTIVNGLLPDRNPDALPKVAVTGKWYDRAQSPTSFGDAGISVRINGNEKGGSHAHFLKGLCTIEIKAETPSMQRYLSDEVQMILIRDGAWLEGELKTRSFEVSRPFEQSKKELSGRDVDADRDFSHDMLVTWIAIIQTSDWSERAF